jgi:uncharacterized protein
VTKVSRLALITAGTICVVIGAVALVIPVVPTTPFLLVAAACYAKSSDRFYAWLIHHPVFGSFIRNYREKGGITRRQKTIALATFWPAVIISAIFAPANIWVRGFLVAAGVGVTAYLLWLKTVKDE